MRELRMANGRVEGADEPTCDECGETLVVKPDKPGDRTRWYECPECDAEA